MALALKEIHPVAHATEGHLVRAVRAGDDRAFEQLFSRYRRRITAYVYGLLNDHGRAEDITQEVFISALRRLRETDGAISFKPWIYEIARNGCIDEFRRMSRASIVSLDVGDDSDALPQVQLADFTTPETRWERKQQIGDLCGAFSSLPDNQHRILVLRELEGMSYGEIGAQMGMSRPMVESTLFRARRRITKEYDELASGRRCLDVQSAVDRQDVRAISTLGLRERRRIARHLHHCTDCLRYARMAGIDDSILSVPGPARRVAALLPFGWLRLAWHRARGKGAGHAGARSAHRASGLVQSSPQGLVASKAAAATAALLVTGGSAVTLLHAQATARGATTVPAAATATGSPSLAAAGAPSSARAGTRSSVSRAAAALPTSAAPKGAGGARLAATRTPSGASGSKAAASKRAPAGSRAGAPTSTRSAAATSSGGQTQRQPLHSPLGTVVSKGTGTVSRVVSSLPGTVGSVVAKAPGTAGTVISNAPSTLGTVVNNGPSTVGGVVSPVAGSVGGAVNQAPATVGGVLNKVTGPVGGVLPGGVSKIGSSAPAPHAQSTQVAPSVSVTSQHSTGTLAPASLLR